MWFPVSYTKTSAGAEHGSCGHEVPLHAQVFENMFHFNRQCISEKLNNLLQMLSLKLRFWALKWRQIGLRILNTERDFR